MNLARNIVIRSLVVLLSGILKNSNALRILKFLCGICCASLLLGCSSPLASEITEPNHLENAMTLLNEGNYEEAIIEFSSAIEIDERNSDAYRGRALAYSKNAQYDLAIADYETMRNLNSFELDDYNRLINAYLKNNDFDNALLVAKEKKEQFGTKSLNLDSKEVLEVGEILTEFASTLDSTDDINEIKDAIDQYGFARAANLANGAGPLIMSRGDKAVVVYDLGEWGRMVYYGALIDGKRTGYGYWCSQKDIHDGCYIERGEWRDDYPNGSFESHHFLGKPYQYTMQRGTVKNGLWDGTVTKYFEDDSSKMEYDLTFTDGVVEVIGTEVFDGHVVNVISYPKYGSYWPIWGGDNGDIYERNHLGVRGFEYPR